MYFDRLWNLYHVGLVHSTGIERHARHSLMTFDMSVYIIPFKNHALKKKKNQIILNHIQSLKLYFYFHPNDSANA